MSDSVIGTLSLMENPSRSASCNDLLMNLPAEVPLQHGRYVLGRGKDANVTMSIRVNNKEIISRAHAEIICSNNNILFVKDLNSLNGVYVNGVRINKQMLYDGDIIQLGGVSMMPTGKVLKQSGENVKYKFCYNANIRDPLRFSTPSLSSKADISTNSHVDDLHVQVKYPFEREMKTDSSVTSTPLLINTKKKHKVDSMTAKKRELDEGVQFVVDAPESKRLRQQENRLIMPDAAHSKMSRSQLNGNLHEKAEQYAEREAEYNQELIKIECKWKERNIMLETEVERMRRDLNQKSADITRLENELTEKDEACCKNIELMKENCEAELKQQALQQQRTFDDLLGNCKEEWRNSTRQLETKIQESHDICQQKELEVTKLEKLLQDKDTEIALQKKSYDSRIESRDEVWVEKMNSLVKSSADDSKAYKDQIRKLHSQHTQDKKIIESLKNELHALRNAECQKTPEEMSPSLPENGTCSIGVDALLEYVTCALCQQPMLDAVVCRCSHGFCRACLELYLRNTATKIESEMSKYSIHKTIASIKANNISRNISYAKIDESVDPYESFSCPVCLNDSTKHAKGNTCPYFRSENLDSIIYLCQQASSSEDRKAYEQRETNNFHLLKSFGIDPMASTYGIPELPPQQEASNSSAPINPTAGDNLEEGIENQEKIDSDNDSVTYGNFDGDRIDNCQSCSEDEY